MSAVLRNEACSKVFLKARESLDQKMESAVRSMIGYSKHSESDSLGELGFGSCLLLALISALSNSELMLSAALLELSASYSPLKSSHFTAWLVEDYTIDVRVIEKALELLFRIDRSGLFCVPGHMRKLFLKLAQQSGICTDSFRSFERDMEAGTEGNAEAGSINTEENVGANRTPAEENSQEGHVGDSAVNEGACSTARADHFPSAESQTESDIMTMVNAVPTDSSTYAKNSCGGTNLHTALNDYKNTTQSLTREQRKVTSSRIQNIIKSIADHKGDINITNAAGDTALHIAAEIADAEVVQSLLAAGAVLDKQNNVGDTPLHVATSCNNYTVLEKLISSSCCNVIIKNNSGKSPLHLAVSYGFKDCLKILLEAGGKQEDGSGYTPLCRAAENGDVTIVKLLCQGNVEINHTIKVSRKTPLHLAAEKGLTDIVKVLLDKGADVQAKARGCIRSNSWSELSPLHLAASGGHLSTVQELLARGAVLEAKSGWGCTPLHLAAREGHLSTVQELLARGAELEAKSGWGCTPLHYAAMGGHLSTVQELLARGAELEAKGRGRLTPLHFAAMEGHHSTVQELLVRGAELEAKGVGRRTPLHFAARGGHLSTVQELLARGAGLEAKDGGGGTPLYLAAGGGHLSTVQELLARGAELKAKRMGSRTPLHWAAKGGHLSTVQELVARGAELEAKSGWGCTPLHYAAMGGHLSTVQELLARGAKLEARNRSMRTPLECVTIYLSCVATFFNRQNEASFLRSKGR